MIVNPNVAQSQCDGNVFFDTQIQHFTGDNPHWVSVADFNEDGIQDLAVANSYVVTSQGVGSDLSILLGNGAGGVGDGTFAAPVDYDIGNQPYGIAVGDFNEDDILDLAATNFQGTEIAILLGQGAGGVGDGTFSNPDFYPAGMSPFHIVTADFNEDGILDLATSLNSEAAVAVLLGNGNGGVGDGTFAAPTKYGLLELSTGIEAADVNEDGILDLVATENFNGTVAVLLGQGNGGVGDGTFVVDDHYEMGPEPFSIDIVDLNSDGILDIVAANGSSGGTKILFGNGSNGIGDGSFGPQSFFMDTGNSGYVHAEDINLDGRLDILVTTAVTFVNTPMVVYLGNGTGADNDGTFESTGIGAGVGEVPLHIAIGDFNEDGAKDAVVSNFRSTYISQLDGICDFIPPPPPNEPVLFPVKDVPNDQGGFVFLRWQASALDVNNGPVIAYRVWRQIPKDLARSMGLDHMAQLPDHYHVTRSTLDGSEIVFWEALEDLPAQRLEGYGYTAPTTQDSTVHSNPLTSYFVTALTYDIDLFWNSNVESGYSVDNIPPSHIGNFVGEIVEESVHLTWDPSSAPDLSEYRLYRGSTADFDPSSELLLTATTETEFTDPGGMAFYYKLAAVDDAGNVGPFAMVEPLSTVDVPPGTSEPRRFALYPSLPNPMRTAGVVRFDVPRAAPVDLSVYDSRGRLMRKLVDGSEISPGRHEITWDGRDDSGRRLPAGIYFQVMESPGFRASNKVVLLD